MSENIESLRAALFETLRGIRDGSVDLEKAKAINDTAQTIINTAKVEVEFAKATGHTTASGFIALEPKPDPRAGIKTVPVEPRQQLRAAM